MDPTRPQYNPLDPSQWNRYTYTADDPINYVDPAGRNAETVRPPCAPGEPVWIDYINLIGSGLTAIARYTGTGTGGGVGTFSQHWVVDDFETGMIFAFPIEPDETITSVTLRFSGVGFILGYGCGVPFA